MKKRDISNHRVVHAVRKYSPSISHFSHADSEEDASEPKKKSDKRSKHLLRESERDFKLNVQDMDLHKEEKEGKLPITYCNFKVESSSCFLSLNSKLIKTAKQWRSSATEVAKNRSEFHEYLENLSKVGNPDVKDKSYKTQVSHEHLWQTELKDMIWLELKARLADRTVDEQDKYLLDARNSVPQLLDDILNYRFERKQDKLSAQSSDSGVFISLPEIEECSGCLSLFCPCCMEQEVLALKEVRTLLDRLEKAEVLFPSSKCFGHIFPLYKSKEFYGKVKAMCLWYNMMRQFRLKTIIIGKQILCYADGSDFFAFHNSNDDILNPGGHDLCVDYLQQFGKVFFKTEEGDTRGYRMFLEHVLKTKGFKKAFQFMENLHLKLLRKARIALERPTEGNMKSYTSYDETNLLKYGYWSDEYQSMKLPSFRSAFLFMSQIPLDVIHEFLRMRLETKLEKPSCLSIRQLMKELKEALKLAVINKERYLYHCEVALIEFDEETHLKFKDSIKKFDETVEEIIQLYLTYLEQWVSLTQFSKLQKNVLEEDWSFITYTVPHFPNCESNAYDVFCNISCSLLQIIRMHIKDKIDLMLKEFSEDSENEESNLCVSVFSSSNPNHRKMLQLCRGLQTLFLETRDRTIHVVVLMKILVKYCEETNGDRKSNIKKSFEDSLKGLRGEAFNLCTVMKEKIALIENLMPKYSMEDSENFSLHSRCREVVHQMYRYTFEYYKEIGKIVTFKACLIRDMFKLAQSWLKFVRKFCEKGRGVRPRWANFGVEFILFISTPKFTKHLTEEEFEVIQKALVDGIKHIKGCAEQEKNSSSPASPSGYYYRQSFSNPDSSLSSQGDKIDGCLDKRNLPREERLVNAINKLEQKMESKLREEELIGNVVSTSNNTMYDKNFIKPRSVTFGWQRGIKIGQGRFGKVYTAVNNDTGELMAMKEIPLSPNDVRTIKSVATELKILEGIKHDNVVRYYGAEIHRDELLIFMELCPEGTLEELILASENGLPESIVRRYSKQLISAVSTLHEHSVVHRDIKTANIFLTSEGNKLKLGDFGSAVKIRAHTTVPGELKGFVGTQAYMAPEVFMKTNTVGHGRAADIWSLGCVVIEMSSGKRPWSEYDSNYQIMFKVGMGETPAVPETLSDEGKAFINKCIQHNPKRRSTIKQLINDNFLKVESEDDGLLCTMPSVLEEYLRLGIKR
uniref:Mitogen-activated protein kinase kinase kinase 4 n=1 Tax=Riptortus pedestris TaxID=329032 RepID=R4WQK7_RIPPE|nr:mitogen activated protein kinase kinase kinase 4, mapkkk4, mekk4 [Riptortus pedestris]